MKKSIIRLICVILLLLIVGSVFISCSKDGEFDKKWIFGKTAEKIINRYGDTPHKKYYLDPDYYPKTEDIYFLRYELGYDPDSSSMIYLEIEFNIPINAKETPTAYSVREVREKVEQ